MTRTGRTLDEYMNMGASGLVALISFIKYLPPDSALAHEWNPKDEFREWYGRFRTNAILADIFDAIVAANTPKGRKAKEYPRPKQKRGIGREAIPLKDFWSWWNEKR